MPHEILSEAKRIQPWLVDVRRDFHRHPEFGMEEFRTQEKIITYLTEMGIPCKKIANTGVVGFIKGAKPGKTIALRADMDALPIDEQNDVDYKSTIPGKMHACGHDAHMTVLLGAAKLLQAHRDELQGNVKLMFQPAEETVGGAEPMIAEGVLEDPKVDASFGLHMSTGIPTGKIGVIYDQMNASSDSIKLTIKGAKGHGAYPHNGRDAIVIAAHVITAMQTIVSRNVDPRKAAVISLGTISGGTQSNVIADEVVINGTVRTLDPEVRELVIERVKEVLSFTTRSLGGDYDFEHHPGYVSLINDNKMVDIVKASGDELLGKENVQWMDLPNMGVEDFAYFAAAVPSAFFQLGCRNEEKGIIHGGHTSQFDIDEDSLSIGAALQVQNVWKALDTL